MKKVGILTATRTNNFGTDLQALAMQYIFSKYSNAELIDYQCERLESGNRILPRVTVKNLIKLPYALYKYISHFLFRKHYFKFSQTKYTVNSLCDINDKYDAVVVGSDQIWNMNLTGNDVNFFLPWDNMSFKKYSYAASLGSLNVKDWDKNFKISEYLYDFENVSVRETSGIEALSQIGISAKEDLDPIQLLDKDDWKSFSNEGNRKPYMIIYLVETKTDKCREAIEYAKAKGLKIIRISPITLPYKQVKTESFVSLKKWMTLLRNAELIITDSYHGLSFSIANHVNFRLINLSSDDKNTRSFCLLKKLSLSDFRLDINNNFDDYPNWDKVAENLREERERSLKYIEEICH